jgi:hypothetical protein
MCVEAERRVAATCRAFILISTPKRERERERGELMQRGAAQKE